MTASEATLRYDPSRTFGVTHRDVVYRTDGGRELLARVYQPEGPGPFPAMIGLHGGAWAGKEWLQNEPAHQRFAGSGLVLAAIQFRTSADAPHPAALEDINRAMGRKPIASSTSRCRSRRPRRKGNC